MIITRSSEFRYSYHFASIKFRSESFQRDGKAWPNKPSLCGETLNLEINLRSGCRATSGGVDEGWVERMEG